MKTRKVIINRGMAALGAGHNLSEPADVYCWRHPGQICVGTWAAAKVSRNLATRHRTGVEPATVARAREAVERMQAQGVNLKVALIHSGCIGSGRPDPEDVRLLRSFAEAGFDIVAASHSHRISGYERLEVRKAWPSFCFYGLGTIVSGYVSSDIEREGMIVIAEINKRGELARIRVRPVWVGASGFGATPTPEKSQEILERFAQLSSEIVDGTYENRFYRDLAPGILRLYLRDVGAALRQTGLCGVAKKISRVRGRHLRRLTRGLIR